MQTAAEAWTEGATAEEIAAWEKTHPAPAPPEARPETLETLGAKLDYMAMMLDMEEVITV